MTCTMGISKDGNPFIACRRGDRQPFINRDQLAIVRPDSPWQVGRRVMHRKHGAGTIVQRNSDAVSIAFDKPAGRVSAFLIKGIGNTMEVTP